MSRIRWRRPLVLAVASVALATGTACAAQASPGVAPGVSQVAPADHAHCGQGGEGGKGGAPGEPGEPGKPGGRGCFTLGDLPDKPKSELTVVDKLRIVLIVESGHAKKSDVAKKYKVSEKEIDTWVKQVRDGDWAALLNLNSLFGS
ncbi:helix-turn-helix domain-containing protein [Streptomyces sp. NPDC050625]|uniref:helix-turn-helix domain-containing protein n=1 Tax=Streptomyces sp. NPDC050625 TaxID=3154629 RepID=UPI00341514FC